MRIHTAHDSSWHVVRKQLSSVTKMKTFLAELLVLTYKGLVELTSLIREPFIMLACIQLKDSSEEAP